MVDIFYDNKMKVVGNSEKLDKFKSDLDGNHENGPLSFQNVLPEPQDTSEWEDGYYSSSGNWRFENWGCPYDAVCPKVKDEGEYLYYTFDTDRNIPIPIYQLLVDKYSALNFEIHINRIIDWNIDDMVEIELDFKNGELVKNIRMYKKYVPWRNEQAKELHYKEDLLKNTLQVYKEEIFELPETKSLPATNDDLLAELDGM